jgi:type IV secretion system protein VirB10
LLAALFLLPVIVLAQGQAAGEMLLEKGTRITLQLNDHLSTRLSKEGHAFTAIVTAPVVVRDRVVIPKGSVVAGSVTHVQRPGRFRGKAVMNLLFESVRIPGKSPLPIVASLLRVDPEGNTGTEGAITGEGSGRKDAGTVAKPGLAGAGIGGLIGGGKGAAIGAGIGAAAGLGTVFSTRGKDLEVRRGSTMEIVLDRPLPVLVEHDGPPPVKIR